MPEEKPTTPLMTKRVNLFLDENLYSRLNEAAWTTRVNTSEFIRQAIKESLESQRISLFGQLLGETRRSGSLVRCYSPSRRLFFLVASEGAAGDRSISVPRGL